MNGRIINMNGCYGGINISISQIKSVLLQIIELNMSNYPFSTTEEERPLKRAFLIKAHMSQKLSLICQ